MNQTKNIKNIPGENTVLNNTDSYRENMEYLKSIATNVTMFKHKWINGKIENYITVVDAQ